MRARAFNARACRISSAGDCSTPGCVRRAMRKSVRRQWIATKGSVESAEDPQQEKLRQEIEEVYRNLEMIMRTEDLKPEERQQLEEEIRRYKQEQEATFRGSDRIQSARQARRRKHQNRICRRWTSGQGREEDTGQQRQF